MFLRAKIRSNCGASWSWMSSGRSACCLLAKARAGAIRKLRDRTTQTLWSESGCKEIVPHAIQLVADRCPDYQCAGVVHDPWTPAVKRRGALQDMLASVRNR